MEESSFTGFVSEDFSDFYSTLYPDVQGPHFSPFESFESLMNDGDAIVPTLATNSNDCSTNSSVRDILSIVPAIEEEENPNQTKVKHRSTKRSRVSSTAAFETAPVTQPPRQRRLWVKDRSKDWWEKFNHPDCPDDEFKKEFRMGKASFDFVCSELESIITKKNTMLRAAIPVRQRVAVCIWRLATGESLRSVADKFGIGLCTCRNLVQDVCLAIKTVLIPKFLHWPDESNLDRIKMEFESVSGISNIGGSIYTTHIPIVAPELNVDGYLNKRQTERNNKKCYSIAVQGVVDARGIFLDVSIGWPGSMPDDIVLEKSALFQWASRGSLNNTWMVGNSGYPLMDWVLVPYTHTNVTWSQYTFNDKIEAVQKIAREAFSRLKCRWRCLQKRTEVNLQDLSVVLEACCVLHNICEKMNDGIDSDLESTLKYLDDQMVPENLVRSAAAVQQRDHIAHNLLHHG